MADEAHLRRLPGALRRGVSPPAFRSGAGPVIEVHDEARLINWPGRGSAVEGRTDACLFSRLHRKMPTIVNRTAPIVDIGDRLLSKRIPMCPTPSPRSATLGYPLSSLGCEKPPAWPPAAGMKHLAQILATRLPYSVRDRTLGPRLCRPPFRTVCRCRGDARYQGSSRIFGSLEDTLSGDWKGTRSHLMRGGAPGAQRIGLRDIRRDRAACRGGATQAPKSDTIRHRQCPVFTRHHDAADLKSAGPVGSALTPDTVYHQRVNNDD
jgi:hypothetical protein